MPGSLEHPRLFFEGGNDLHAVMQISKKHGIKMSDKEELPPPDHIICVSRKTVGQLIGDIEGGIKGSRTGSVGFILDADAPLSDQWAKVRRQLIQAHVEQIPENPARRGVHWLDRAAMEYE